MKMDFKSIDDKVARIMIKHGPDGHCDGSAYITRYIQSLLVEKDRQYKEQIELIMKYTQSILEIGQIKSHINE